MESGKMRAYDADSPETMARLLTALMAIDDRIEDAEIEALTTLDVCRRIGISSSGFAEVLRAYFADLQATGLPDGAGGSNRRRLHESPVYVQVIDAVTDETARMLLWEIMVGLARADGDICANEAAFLSLVAQRWWLGQVPSRLQRPASLRAETPQRRPAAGRAEQAAARAVHWQRSGLSRVSLAEKSG